LTGTGPDSWSHDGTSAGIFDLSGNVWDWVSGLRVKDGEIQVIPDNDSALGADEGENSPLWRAIGTDGAFVAPGTPGTYKYDGVNPGTGATDIVNVPGGAKLNTSVTNPHYSGEDDALRAYTFMPFAELAAQPGVPVHVLLKELVLFPVSADVGKGIFFLRNYGERVPARGGSWFDGPTAGFWDFYIREPRTFVYPDIGFRASYVEL
ncbi:MAG: hypothetical protein LBN99_04210, partial [Oscillospiraceae bacterium]|nr:hypothetical protein [Oscillospiraceae bacterium]